MSDLEETPPAEYDDGDVEELENDPELDIPEIDEEPDFDGPDVDLDDQAVN